MFLQSLIKVIINAKFTFIRNVTNDLLAKINSILLNKHFIITIKLILNYCASRKKLKIYLIITINANIIAINKIMNIN